MKLKDNFYILLDVEFLNESTHSYTEETLFLETQDYELHLSELEEEADEEENADEDNDGEDLDDKDNPDIGQINGEECHQSIRRLLRILNAKTDLNLPTKDPPTLLGTLRNRATMSNIGEGKCWYHGISHALTKELQKYTNVPDHLHYDINIDGLPLHKRSKTHIVEDSRRAICACTNRRKLLR
ncbi:uncharacterized protein LOC118511141 [Anopheles stephensi]|uniref:uncharacterized protein LOC118511141 n=1 Tax=Anopheles stephensi TaxID=30069 RepID=UPI001658C01E|nr:uncharacterized protein LOC118511141 [Anopheles stephensi]